MSKPLKIDDIDRAILRILQDSSDHSITEIASRVGLSHTPCWRRLKRFEETGVIRARVALLNAQSLGLLVTALVFVKLKGHDEDILRRFEAQINDIDEVVECHSVTGEKDFHLKVVTDSISSFDQLLKKRIMHLPGVATVSSYMALAEIKNTTKLPL